MSEKVEPTEASPGQDGPVQNTDRHLWPPVIEEGAPHETMHVTAGGGIGINIGGYVIVKPMREWHRLAAEPALHLHAMTPEQKRSMEAALLKSGPVLQVLPIPSDPSPLRRARIEALEEAAKRIEPWLTTSKTKLHVGELTANELRAVVAVVGVILASVRALINQEGR